MQPIEYLGPAPLFIGVESATWSLANFQSAASAAKALGVTALLVKIADGANVWYGSLGGPASVFAAIKQAGITPIPYAYCYGNVYGALQSEINILATTMRSNGIVIADMEAPWNGQAAWAQQVCAALQPIPGRFGVTTFADPGQQDWQSVLAALAPCVDFWLPQVYTDALAGMYQAQFATYSDVYPVLNLGADFGPNNVAQIALTAQSPILALWEYQAAIGAYAAMVQGIIAAMKPQGDAMPITDPFAAAHFALISPTIWKCTTPGHQFYVHDGNLAYYCHIQGAPRLPLGPETYGVIAAHPECSVQLFESGAIIYDPKNGYDNPGLGQCYLVKLNQDSPILRSYIAAAGLKVA